MGGKPMNTEMYEKIVTDRLVFGVPANKIAKDIERNPATITVVVSGFEAVRDGNWDKCIDSINKYKTPLSLFTWAANKLGVEVPPTLEAAYEQRKAQTRDYKLQKRAGNVTQPTPVPPPEPAPAQEPKKEDKTALYLLKLLEAVNTQNELLEQLYDVVIPKWTGDIKDNINCNCDVLSQSLKRIDDKLEAIKINVRKRGM